MKNFLLLFISLITGIFTVFTSSVKKEPIITNYKPLVGIVECLPAESPVLMDVTAFKSKYGLEPLRTRRNINLIPQAEINAIKVGILKMKALPYTNPTSWGYQSAIHGTTLPDDLPSWNTCHKAGESIFFFAWHRMYVYFFERILRAKSGRADVTIPYWDIQTDPVMPAAFRDNTPSNPLYVANRNPAINNGGALPASIQVAFNNSLDIIPYFTFQSNVSGGPHGSVHTTINGDMTAVSTAANDPIFWVYHAGIDRLWEAWRIKCGGRANPIDETWLNKTYVFFDENGIPVSITGSQVVEIAAELHYKYDDLPDIIACPSARSAIVTRQSLLTKEVPVEISGQKQQTEFAQESSSQLDAFAKTKNSGTFNFTSRDVAERLVITFEGLTIEQMPEGVIEVYLNLPAGQTPNPSSKYFVGLMDLFSTEHHNKHHMSSQRAEDSELDATKAAQALGLTIKNLRNASVSFFVRGARVKGVEAKTQAKVTIRRIRFSVDKYQN